MRGQIIGWDHSAISKVNPDRSQKPRPVKDATGRNLMDHIERQCSTRISEIGIID